MFKAIKSILKPPRGRHGGSLSRIPALVYHTLWPVAIVRRTNRVSRSVREWKFLTDIIPYPREVRLGSAFNIHWDSYLIGKWEFRIPFPR